jgi:DNA-binding transcriptional regulator YdaS (Cro superfamily)
MGSDMDLKTYLSPLSLDQREAFAKRCGTTRGHMQNVAYGKTCAPALATAIERETEGAVKRQDMRPSDYWRIWPDLPQPKQPRRVALMRA